MNIGIIGCGRIADLHARAYKAHDKARIYAVCDPDTEKVAQRCAEWGAQKAYSDYHELLKDPEISAVEILTPYDTHEAIIIAAAKAGKHVACQKPMTTSLASAYRIADAVRKSGIHFQLTEIYVHYPPIAFAKRLIEEGRIGEPVGMRIDYIASPRGGWEVPPSTYTQQTRIAARGFGLSTFDHGHHEWATAWYLLGEAECVSAWIDTNDGVLDCPAVIMWKGKNNKRYGVCQFLFASDMTIPTHYYSNDELYRIVGTKGVIHINRGTGMMSKEAPVCLFDGQTWTEFHDMPVDWGEGFVRAGHHFFNVLAGQATPLLSLEQGTEVLRFGLAVMEAARCSREVYLDEIETPLSFFSTLRRRVKKRRECIVAPRHTKVSWFGGDLTQYAPQAEALTESLLEKFDGSTVQDWQSIIALELLDAQGNSTHQFAFYFDKGTIRLEKGVLPKNAVLTVHMETGLWAAILLKKKRIETALIQGKIKFEGRGEEALLLKKAFKF